LTNLTGYTISFKTAIVPRWGEGSIRLGNVHILCNDESWIKVCEQSAKEENISFDPSKVDVNFTYVDLQVDHIDISLSLWRWLDGKRSLY
jgi:distribution and morphology protein 31